MSRSLFSSRSQFHHSIVFVMFLFLFVTADALADTYYNSSEPGCDGSDPNILWCDDFEDGVWAKTDCDNGGTTDPNNDGWCMTIFFPSNHAGFPESSAAVTSSVPGADYSRCGSLGAAGTDCAATSTLRTTKSHGMMGDHNLKGGAIHDEIYLRWYEKPLTGFRWGHEKMMTINRFAGSGGIVFGRLSSYFSSGTPRYFAQAEVSLNFNDVWLRQNISEITLTPGSWYYMEIHIKLNTNPSCTLRTKAGANCDGVLEMWIDDCGADGLGCTGPGTLRSQYTNIKHRSSNIYIGAIWDENWGNPASIGEAYYDQIIAATKRIGPMGMTVTAIPPAPTNLQLQ